MRKILSSVFMVGVVVIATSGCATLDKEIYEANCNPPDHINWVVGKGECLKIKTFNEEASEKNPILVIFLHGDISRGGAASYFYERAVIFKGSDVVPVVLIRPGYYDSEGHRSTGNDFNRKDNYTPHNIDAIAEGIMSIKEFHKPRKVILVGHSGGAAIAGVILGRHPGLVDGAVLAACPCNISQWRNYRGRSTWTSLSPHSFVNEIPIGTQVIAVTAENDDNTPPFLAKRYIESLKERGIKADFYAEVAGTHFSSARSAEFYDAIWKLVGKKSSR